MGPPHRRRQRGRDVDGRALVAASAWLNALASLAFYQSFGVYVALWELSMGWSAAALAGAFALSRGLMVGTNPLVGHLVTRHGPRGVATVGVVLLAIALSLLGMVRSLTGVYALMPLFTVALTAMGPLTLSSAIVARFRRWRSVAIGLVLTGVGVGGLFVPVLAGALVRHGIGPTLFVLAGVVLLTGLPAVRLLDGHARPASTRRAPTEGAAAAGPKPSALGVTPRAVGAAVPSAAATTSAVAPAMSSTVATPGAAGAAVPARRTVAPLRRPEFWWLGIGHLMAAGTVTSFSLLLVPYVGRSMGMSLEAGGLLVSVLAVASVTAQVVSTPLADRFGHRRAAAFGAACEAIGVLGLATASSPAAAAAWTVLVGLGWGTRSPQMYVLRADYFGQEAFASVMGASMTLSTVGVVIVPIVAAAIFSGPVGPRAAFVLMGCCGVVASLAFAMTPRRRRAWAGDAGT